MPFLEGPPIPKGAEGINFVPRPSREEASLYEHCCRAIDFTLGRIGPHGLPLIGSGDWNDGLSQFGEGGAGESVWLGFFLYDTLIHFADLAQEREGAAKAGAYRERAEQIRLRLDGMWHEDRYPRLIAGNGDAISWFDALMGSWPVLSGCGRLRARPADRGVGPGRPWSATIRSCCSPPGSASTRRACPARSPTIRPACARTAASTRTARPGWSTR